MIVYQNYVNYMLRQFHDSLLLQRIFTEKDTVADTIYLLAKELDINQDVLWRMIRKVTRDIAKERGLFSF